MKTKVTREEVEHAIQELSKDFKNWSVTNDEIAAYLFIFNNIHVTEKEVEVIRKGLDK